MAIKHNIKTLEEVDEVLRSHYKPVDSTDPTKGFVLDVAGAPAPEDTGALKRALEHVRKEKEDALEALRQKGSTTEEMEALRKSSATQIDELRKKITQAEQKERSALLDKTVADIAAELAGQHAGLLVPHLRQRLVIESPDGVNLTRVLGKDLKASALSLDDLKAEVKADPLFAPVLQAGRASGSGTAGSGSSVGGAGGGTERVGNLTKLPANATLAQTVDWLAQNQTPGFAPAQ